VNDLADRLLAQLRSRPDRAFLIALALFTAAWSLAALLTQLNLPLDAVEMLTWGREWQLAYWKHPPLPAWILDLLYRLGGGSHAVLYLASPLAVALTFWAVWRLGRRILPAPLAALAVLPLVGLAYYGFTAPEFNHNVVQYPFFALVPLLLHRAVTGARPPGRAGGRTADWLLLGLVGGLAVYAKYSTAPLLLAAALLLLCHPLGWRALAGRGPWLALGAFLLVAAPHGLALWSLDFLPLQTPTMRAAQASGWLERLWFPLWFLAGQLLNCLGGLLVLVALALPGRAEAGGVEAGLGDPRSALGFDRLFVLWMLGVPLAIVLGYSLLAGQELETMWGSPYFALLGLAGLLLLPRAPSRRGVLAALGLGGLLALAGLGGYAGKNLFEPLTSGHGMRAQFPGPALARSLEAHWSGLSGGAPLPTLVGSFWLAGNAAAYGEQRPPVFIEGRPERSPWVDLDGLASEGALFLWQVEEEGREPDWLAPWDASLCRQGAFLLPWQSWIELPPVRIAWATYGGSICDRPPRPVE
jgi:4-amino-4-deoxy-L-arabinose transferase-like glycosyltransferase